MADDDKKARCWTCKLVFVWSGRPLVRDAGCPKCGARLARTTHDAQVPKVHGVRPAVLLPGEKRVGGTD